MNVHALVNENMHIHVHVHVNFNNNPKIIIIISNKARLYFSPIELFHGGGGSYIFES